MASRWKRFAFFDKHSINLNNDVVHDLNTNGVSMVATTAALPAHTKETTTKQQPDHPEQDPIQAMWSSIDSCSSPKLDNYSSSIIQLPSQAQRTKNTTDAQDGLVLTFLASRETHLIHCIDITARCTNVELQDNDGWRGYFSPFQNQEEDQNIRDMAVCRGTIGHKPIYLGCISEQKLVIWEDPHLYLSCRRPVTTPQPISNTNMFYLHEVFADTQCSCIDISPGLVAVGSTLGSVHMYLFSISRPGLRLYLKIPPPPGGNTAVTSLKIAMGEKVHLFVSYSEAEGVNTGLACYEMPTPNTSSTTLSAPSARHDLDGRPVATGALVDGFPLDLRMKVTVARSDGLYTYSKNEKEGVAPIDGSKTAMCLIPPAMAAQRLREVDFEQIGYGYSLVASNDSKAERDSIDIYDTTNKLVALHMLLSPGQAAISVASITTPPSLSPDGSYRDGRSSAVVFTSGGSLLTLSEKTTNEKISLLVQKTLYSAAIVVAYSDPSFEGSAIVSLYRQYAEYLYKKGDYSASMDQYINTIGSLESSHVIFRFLDAPKIPLLVRYLETLRERSLASPVHNELLRTCYLKLNNTETADSISTASAAIQKSSFSSILTDLSTNPKDALASICSQEAEQVAQIFLIHGTSLVRVLPKESAGIVISLCMGTYSPKMLADAALMDASDLHKIGQYAHEGDRNCEPYPVSMFAPSFIEHPKTLRMILAHCNRNKCPLTPTLRRTLLELTLNEWNHARRIGDVETEKNRRKEAIAALTDSHCREIGDQDALVIVQLAGFEEGESILYERLQMTPMLLERHANEGTEKSRRQMLAMCQTDPDALADVLAYLVKMAGEKAEQQKANDADKSDDESLADEVEEILEDIQEALDLARRQNLLSPVRIVRILAGEGSGQFTVAASVEEQDSDQETVPLAVALDYVGITLEKSRKDIKRLQTEVEEFNELCESMENEIESLLQATTGESSKTDKSEINIDELYARVLQEDDKGSFEDEEQPKEAFWRDLNQSEDTFDVIARFFAKGVIK